MKKNKKGLGPKKGSKRFSLSKDPFFAGNDSKRRRKVDDDDEGDVEGSESDDEYLGGPDRDEAEEGDEDGDDDVAAKETADEARKRLAVAHLEKLREIAMREKEEDDGEEEEEEEGARDSLVAQILHKKQLEQSGRLRRSIASR